MLNKIGSSNVALIESNGGSKRANKRLDKLNIKIHVTADDRDGDSQSQTNISNHIQDTALSAPHCLNKRKKPENYLYFNNGDIQDHLQYTPVPYAEKIKQHFNT
jgi:hypothetical protein